MREFFNMTESRQIIVFAIIAANLILAAAVCGQTYSWISSDDYCQADIVADIPPPPEFRRAITADNGFAEWLRHLPLKTAGTPVRLYDGRHKPNQTVHFRVIDIDIGTADLQQCADAVIRFRAECLFGHRRFEDIHFNFTSGDACRFDLWASGYRPAVSGQKVVWQKEAAPDSGYASFRKYLDQVFTFAGSYSLMQELNRVQNIDAIEIGDIFIRGGFPGHAVLVVDMAIHPVSGQKAVLLAQSYMPAQDIHILTNPVDTSNNPWYPIGQTDSLLTPEWTFSRTDLMRFED